MKLIREVKADFQAETSKQRSVSFLPDGRSVVASPNFGLVAFPSGRVVTGGTPELRVDGSGRFRSRTVAPSRLATELCTESGPLSHDEWKTYIPDIPYRATC